MCDPTALAAGSLVIGGAQAVAGYENQQSAYAQGSAQATLTNEERLVAAINNNMALAQTYNALGNENNNARIAASQETFNDEIKAAQARSSAIVSGAASGVGQSGSLRDVLQNFDAEVGRQNDAIDSNYASTVQGNNDQEQAAYRGVIARNQALPFAQQPAKPNLFSAGLGIAGAGVNAAGQYYRYTNNLGTGHQTPLQQSAESQ